MNGFGLADLRAEGAPYHPDFFENQDDISDEWYLRQLQAYKDYWRLSINDVSGCVRNELLPRLK